MQSLIVIPTHQCARRIDHAIGTAPARLQHDRADVATDIATSDAAPVRLDAVVARPS